MMKKVISYLCVFVILISFGTTVHAEMEQNSDSLPSIDDIVVIDDVTLENTKTNEGYVFESVEERDEFLFEIERQNVSYYVCLPGDPGYPTCTGTTIVSAELQTVGSSFTTGYLQSKNYLCGDGGWVWHPGTVSYSGSAGVGAQLSYNGTVSLSFTYTVTIGASFQVPAGKKGNIKYNANFKLTPQRYKYKLSDGSTTYGAKFYTRKFLDGGFSLVTKAI